MAQRDHLWGAADGRGAMRPGDDASRVVRLAAVAVERVRALRLLRRRRDTASLSEGDYLAAVERLHADDGPARGDGGRRRSG